MCHNKDVSIFGGTAHCVLRASSPSEFSFSLIHDSPQYITAVAPRVVLSRSRAKIMCHLLMQVITLDELLAGPVVKKLLFMSHPEEISEKVMPDIDASLIGTDAESTQAVDSMLEVVPRGVNKWSGISKYLKQVGLGPGNVLAIGDGMNDYEMLLNAGCSVAMANAKQPVIDIADKVTASNDMDGVARALESEILDSQQM